ncbi:hypothetical protein C2845_PM10G06270 [Panicum miliaceum]|uniref:Uncharacterized protein n=1 Tax=Panicum miliaceum TaxID=4540 RepID=A0A3L6P9Z6_PANMI|nr:hypothetical protein C2845_PM10G06270 [Panicum miliaceum]
MLLREDIAALFSSWLFSAHSVTAAVPIAESLLTTAKDIQQIVQCSWNSCFFLQETRELWNSRIDAGRDLDTQVEAPAHSQPGELARLCRRTPRARTGSSCGPWSAVAPRRPPPLSPSRWY